MSKLVSPHDIVEIYHNNNTDVIKYVHGNGSESTLKTIPTCVDDEAGLYVDKGKAVLFVSVSTGCNQNCKFCYLTAKKYHFCPIQTDTVIKSCIEVIKSAKDIIKDKYLKLSFMGMGDVFVSNTEINDVVKKVFMFAYNHGYIKGIDGVDIGTSYPRTDTDAIYKEISRLQRTLTYMDIPRNPFHVYVEQSTNIITERTLVRLFISLHSLEDDVRKYLMPQSSSIETIINEIKVVDIDVIFHYILFNEINDSEKDIQRLISFFEMKGMNNYELRLLRYNKCPNLNLKESMIIEKSIDMLKRAEMKFKYQVSAGSEISAACGQFICKKLL